MGYAPRAMRAVLRARRRGQGDRAAGAPWPFGDQGAGVDEVARGPSLRPRAGCIEAAVIRPVRSGPPASLASSSRVGGWLHRDRRRGRIITSHEGVRLQEACSAVLPSCAAPTSAERIDE